MSHRSSRSSRPGTSKTSSGSTSSELDDLLADDRAHPRADLDAHDVAEAPPAQLVLDRLQQVVGLVGDREVGVAGHAEDVVVDDLHAREQRVEVLGDQVLERHERVAVAGGDEARQHLLRHLHAREGLDRGRPGRAPARRARATGWRCTGRGARGRRPAGSAPGRSGAGSARRALRRSSGLTSSTLTIRMPCCVERGAQLELEAARLALEVLAHDRGGSPRAWRSASARPRAASRSRPRSGRAGPRRGP